MEYGQYSRGRAKKVIVAFYNQVFVYYFMAVFWLDSEAKIPLFIFKFAWWIAEAGNVGISNESSQLLSNASLFGVNFGFSRGKVVASMLALFFEI